jgi:sulfate adenylyltransferase
MRARRAVVGMGATMSSLIGPHGGTLFEAVVDGAEAEALQVAAGALPSLVLDPQELLDLELLATGGASPLRGFMGHRDYRCVLDRQRLASGVLFPVPLTLAVPLERLTLEPGTAVALRDAAGALRGALVVRETFVRDVQGEARLLHGTDDPAHRGVRYLLSRPPGALGGEVVLLRSRVVETAREVRLRLAHHGFRRVAAGFGVGVPQGARTASGRVDVLLVESLAGYVAAAPRFPVLLARLPPIARHAGALDAILHALVLRNFGVSHLFLDAACTDLATADALVRFQRDLGLVYVRGRDPTSSVAPRDARAAA